ncbi:hypothetical protein BLA60_24955 [Actinophytocola xinjiangensis]|uniref:DUF3558 domain-containing protein n=1 Tax=Actinophytocola xinjiangensis TaxID=485602 RepID=A0A7Z0WM26_9PSEU|nr:DUF3558 family protein [Actinophytocola xinjiangensis]OLF08113.1 hypothetical protein BLA60_24955 [Actinophytocola xinjiangensis]
MKGILSVVAALLLVAGCGTQVDTSKVTYPRTTVPAGQAPTVTSSGTEQPVAKANDPAFTPEKLRATDPCELLDEDVLEELGQPAEVNRGGFDECSNYMRDKKGQELNLTVTLGDSIGNAVDADENIGGLPAMENTLDTGDACFVTVITSTSPNLGIVVQVGGKSEELCEAGRTLMGSVVDRIRTDPPVYDQVKGTLAEVDPCTLYPPETLTAPLGGKADPKPFDLHQCSWSSQAGKLDVRMRIGFDPDKGSSGSPVDLGGGLKGYQEKTVSSTATCDVEWKHRVYAGDEAEIVSLRFEKRSPAADEDPCVPAMELAKSLVSALPKA